MTPQEALDRIAALDREGVHQDFQENVRAILAEVSPEPGGVLDRETRYPSQRQALNLLTEWAEGDNPVMAKFAFAVLDMVRPSTFDREAAREVLRSVGVIVDPPMDAAVDRVLDRLAACVRFDDEEAS